MLGYVSYQFEQLYKRLDKETVMPKIKELKPQKRIPGSITFEVAEVIELNKEGVLCKAVDDTGIINAFFNQFAEQIIVGKVFQMTDLKVQVVNNHLRLQMTKQTIITKLPLKMAFKDMENDLSVKFFVQKETEVKKQESEKTENKIQPEIAVEPSKDIENSKQSNQKIEIKEEEKQQKKPQQETKPKKYILKQEKTEKAVSEIEKKQPQDKNKRGEGRQYRDYKKHSDDNDISRRKKYVQKDLDTSYKREKNTSSIGPRVFLRSFYANCNRNVSFFGQVQLDFKKQSKHYFMCLVADKSGAQYIQFEKKTKLEDKAWYRFNHFRIYEDKVYGWVGAQQVNSTIEAVDNVEEVADHRIYKS